jgi:hypothetical protein
MHVRPGVFRRTMYVLFHRMCVTASRRRVAAAIATACALSTSALAPVVQAQATPTNAQVADTLAAEVHRMLAEFAAQRDALGGWPTRVTDGYAALTQLESDLLAARAAGDAQMFRRKYRAFMRGAARLTRWLVFQFEPEADQAPARDRAPAVLSRLGERLALVTQLASAAGVTLDLTEVNAARTQAQTALASGTDAQLRAAVRRVRDAIDALQDSTPDPTD